MMSEIKQIIFALCKVLKDLLEEDIKAEHLRLAKFNKNEDGSVIHLWNVVHKLCCDFYKDGKSPLCKDNPCNVVNCVKLYFATLGYDNLIFYYLPTDMNTGSRELLLAFGWLVAETNNLEIKIIELIKNKILNGGSLRNTTMENNSSTSCVSVEKNHKSIEDLYNCIIWLAGRIRYNLKSINNMIVERSNLISKVRKATKEEFNLSFLSIDDCELLINPDEILATSDDIKNVTLILESYMYFVKNEKVFWEWMESVFAEDDKRNEIYDGETLNQFLELLRKEIRVEIMREPSKKLKINDMFNLLSLHDQNHRIDKSILELDKRIEKLNYFINEGTVEVTKMLDILRTDSCTEDHVTKNINGS